MIKTIQDCTLLVDGNSLFMISYKGNKNPFLNEHNINGVYQFLLKLSKILMDNYLFGGSQKINKIIIFFDGLNSGEARKKISAQYKANRNKKDNDYEIRKSQITILKKYLDFLYIKHYEDDIAESDDCIAHYVFKRKGKENILIASGDYDISQLLDDNVSIYNLNKIQSVGAGKPQNIIITKDNFKSIFKYPYKNIVLKKIVCGDSSDNIKGVHLVQEKTLLDVFEKFKSEQYDLKRLIKEANIIQNERIANGKSKLMNIENLIHGNTLGDHVDDLYGINEKLIDLSKMKLNDETILNIEKLFNIIYVKQNTYNLLIESLKEDKLYEYVEANQKSVKYFLTPYIKYITKILPK